MATIVLAPLQPARDLDSVEVVYRLAADYLALESGLTPAEAARAFFEDRPPASFEAPLKFGIVGDGGALVAIGDLALDYPEHGDVYLGLLLLVPAARGTGLGSGILSEIKKFAEQRGAPRLLLGVIDGNARARAFWERQGFKLVQTSGPHALGHRRHIVHRLILPLADTASDCP